MNKAIQEQIRPQLFRVEERGHAGNSRVIQPVTPGHAVALLGAPGVDLRRIAREEILREIMEETLVVWLDLASLQPGLYAQPGAEVQDGAWEAALDALFQSGFEQALAAEGIAADALTNEAGATTESPQVARVQAFATLTRRLRRAPVLVIEAMHRLPDSVSERLQGILRKALDNGDRPRILRVVLTSSSDFLSGDILRPGEDDPTSPLYFRTTRYYVVPWTVQQLSPLLPLPGGLPDEILDLMHELSGGSPGLLELVYAAFAADPGLARALLECRDAVPDLSENASWFYAMVVRLESIARPARQLIREGLGALLSSSRGRGRSVATALSELLAGRLVEETVVDPLLPLELAGLARTERVAGVYRYQFCSPLVTHLLRSVMPAGKSLRDQLDRFNQTFDWSAPLSMEAQTPTNEPQPFNVRLTSGGARMHVVATSPGGGLSVLPVPEGGTTGPTQGGTGTEAGAGTLTSGDPTSPGSTSTTAPESPKGPTGTGATTGTHPRVPVPRAPMQIPGVVRLLQQDQGPESARLLIELLVSVATAVSVGRKTGSQTLLTPSALEVRWFSKTGETHAGSEAGTTSTPGTSGSTDPLTVESIVRLLARWDVQLLPSISNGNDTQQLEAAALFLPGESLPRLLTCRAEGRTFQPESSDDAWAMGQFVGLLLALEPDPRLVVSRIEGRLATAEDLAVGVLIRLVRSCLDPVPARRPGLEEITRLLDAVLRDSHGTSRRLIRYASYASMALVVTLGIWDFFLDTRVDNPNWFYTGIKVVGAAAWAAFYFLGWLIFGRSDREHFTQQLWNFIVQRRNRVRWLVFPALVAAIFSGFFFYRLFFNQGVTLTLAPGQKLEEIKERLPDSDGCSSVVKLATPLANPTVRLLLDERDYVFIVDEETPGKAMVRRQLYWPAAQVVQQRDKRWGETLYLFALAEPPADKSCLPQVLGGHAGAGKSGGATVGGAGVGAADPARANATGPGPASGVAPGSGAGIPAGPSSVLPASGTATPAPAPVGQPGPASGSGGAGAVSAPTGTGTASPPAGSSSGSPP